MIDFPPPSPSSPQMRYAEKMVALAMKNSSEESIARKQKKIRSLAQSLLKEISLFVECKAEEQIVETGAPRELPIFFVKSYNELKKMAKELKYEDAYLNFLPNGVRMQVLTELGPSVHFPKTVSDYFLEEEKAPIAEEIKRLQDEILFYLGNKWKSSQRIKELPVFFHLTVKSLQQRAEVEDVTEKEKQMAQTINRKMQKILEDAFPRKVYGGLVEDCVYAHNLDI